MLAATSTDVMWWSFRTLDFSSTLGLGALGMSVAAATCLIKLANDVRKSPHKCKCAGHGRPVTFSPRFYFMVARSAGKKPQGCIQMHSPRKIGDWRRFFRKSYLLPENPKSDSVIRDEEWGNNGKEEILQSMCKHNWLRLPDMQIRNFVLIFIQHDCLIMVCRKAWKMW